MESIAYNRGSAYVAACEVEKASRDYNRFNELADQRISTRAAMRKLSSELCVESLRARKILPHGSNGEGPIHPVGWRGHHELKALLDSISEQARAEYSAGAADGTAAKA